ncbi:plasma membrane ascorbate-dependent reductase CYBRD1 isoform X1 [Protopterus annectens]|uniref:plasma membrane ascorbate-dependent reductase CYBRD1 isoform X1 n=1 Tax=Protopterus annectens TaxID=7888 RepID=UPI001CFB937B|nr:plasma membrane ascorbate-dependent reductase CYBRD1 isoform X1 [Protopterus annectens]
MEGYKRFLSFLAFSTVFGFAAVLFVLVWVLLWREGLGWDGGAPEFNWHPVLAVSGFIFIQGIAIIVYRLPWTWRCSKRLMKCIHAGLNTVAFILMSISLVAVFDFHNAKNIPNMYSLHSWIGLAAVILYSLQLFIGFLVYLLPFSPAFLRSALLPVHTYSGILIFGTVIAAALMGITEKLIFSLKAASGIIPYSKSPPEAIFVNTLGVLIFLFGAFIFWMVTRPEWKRPPEQDFMTQQSAGKKPDVTEDESTATDHSMDDLSDVELHSEMSARKQNQKLDEAGQRSTM